MNSVIVVGVGEVFRKNWGKVLPQDKAISVIGIIDYDTAKAESVAQTFAAKPWVATSLSAALEKNPVDIEHTVVLVLTPDHYPVIQELAHAGFRKIIVEKPPVSRYGEIAKLRILQAAHPIRIFAVDQYIPKTLPLQDLMGVLVPEDPRRSFLKIRHGNGFSGLWSELGPIEGVSLAILESGDFCLPDLKKRPWLRYDPEIGGMLRDLGTHAFAPLIAAGILTSDVEVCKVDLAKLEEDDATFTPLSHRDDVEMYCSILLREQGIPIQASFGKVPGEGGIWSLTIRFRNGMFYGSLRGGQPSVVILDNGVMASEVLAVSPVQFLIKEAELFFDNQLPGFDGNAGAILTSLELCERISRTSQMRP